MPSINQAKILSITLFRANMFNQLVGTKISVMTNQSTRVPYDIDDLEVTDDTVSQGVAAAANPAKQATQNIRDGSTDPLNWQQIGNGDYLTRLRRFRRNAKQLYTERIQQLLSSVQSVDQFKTQITRINLTPYATVNSITRDLAFGNRCVLKISLPELRDKAQTPRQLPPSPSVRESLGNFEAVPRENDVIQVIAEYADGRQDRWFLGLVSTIEYTEQYREITTITVTCHGLSKLLQINKLVVDRAWISQVEDGAMPQTGLSVIGGGSFAEKTVDQIFISLMISQLASMPSESTLSVDPQTKFMVEAAIAKERILSLEATIRELYKTLDGGAVVLVDKAFKDPRTGKARALQSVTSEDDDFGRRKLEELRKGVQPLITESAEMKQPMVPGAKEDAENLLAALLISVQLGQRVLNLTKEGGMIEKGAAAKAKPSAPVSPAAKEQVAILNTSEATLKFVAARQAEEIIRKIDEIEAKAQAQADAKHTPEVRLDFQFDKGVISSADQFQFIYVPLITMMAVRNKNSFDGPDAPIVAKFRGRRARAYDFMIRKGFQNFFSQLGTPDSVLDHIRTAAKFVVYENELNQIICEIPRYNDFGADEGEEIDDFIIANPSSITVTHDDTNLMARVDVKGYQPLIGELPGEGLFQMGQYTDTAAFLRYGMRLESPIYNPNVTSLEKPISPFIFAAIELAFRNAKTRTMTVEVIATQKYRVGRMYFVQRESLDRIVGGPQSDVVSQMGGYVGYLSQLETRIQHGAPITHVLTFQLVRRARLIPIYKDTEKKRIKTWVANFRVLPDITGLMDVLENKIPNAADVFGTPLKTPPVGTAEIMKNANGEFYVSSIYIKDARQRQLLGLDIDYLPVKGETVSTNFPGEYPTRSFWRFAVAKSGAISHRILPPISGSPTRMATIRVDRTGQGLQRNLIDALALTDLRLRVFNGPLLSTPDPNGGQEPAVDLKTDMFELIYIPTEKVNAFCELTSLAGDPRKAITEGLHVGIPNFNKPLEPTVQLPIASGNYTFDKKWMQTGSVSIASEQPMRIKDNKTPQFVILRYTPRSLYTLDNPYAISADFIRQRKFEIADRIHTASHNVIDQSTVIDIIDNYFTATDGDFVPVVFQNPQQDAERLLEVFNPGIPMTIYDASRADVSTFTFPGTLDMTSLEGSEENAGQRQLAHAAGNAIDLTLFPWIARTGVHLKYSLANGYPLDPNYDLTKNPAYSQLFGSAPILVLPIPSRESCGVALAGSAVFTGNDALPTEDVELQYAKHNPGLRESLDLATVPLALSPDDASKVQTRQAFDDMLATIGVKGYISVDDVYDPGERVLWHLEV